MADKTPRGSATAREFKSAVRTRRETKGIMLAEIKADENAAGTLGTISGYLAIFGNVDGNGDVIERTAFKKTLNEAREVKARTHSEYLYPLLWQHKEAEPIGGIVEATEDDKGLFIRAQLDLDIEQGRRAYSGMKKGYLRGLSIGYETVKSMWKGGARHLLEIRLHEGSPVTFPANDDSLATSVKSLVATMEDMEATVGGPTEGKAVTGSTDWPLGERDAGWDAGKAHNELLEWAGGKDSLDTAKFASVHFWSPDDRSKVSEYKFPFCDIVGGKPQANWGAITAATGAHGIQAAKGVDVEGIKGKIATYYAKAAKKYDDDTIEVPWKAASKARRKALDLEHKDYVGLQAVLGCAGQLDSMADEAEYFVESLAEACGMSVEDGESSGKPHPVVAALLGSVDGLEDAVKAVIQAWQEFSDQTDALKAVLGMPDNDDYGYGNAVPMYMSELRSALELKAGRQLSSANRTRLQKVADGLDAHSAEVKSILKDNDRGDQVDENAQDVDIDQIIAAGKKPSNNYGGQAKGRKAQKPGDSTTSDDQPTEPDDGSTLQELSDLIAVQRMEFGLQRR